MRDPGLSLRLSQRSRRSGLLIGLSMALAIAVLIGAFALIYAWLDPFTTDFVTKQQPTVVARQEQLQARNAAQQVATQAPPAVAAATEAPSPTAAPSPSATAAIQQITPTSQAFKPDYQIRGDQGINLRSQPTTDSDIVTTLSPSTPLQYLNQQEATDNPDQDGPYWMKFRTENGDVGWVRQIDVNKYSQ